jgi:hypothetical protein
MAMEGALAALRSVGSALAPQLGRGPRTLEGLFLDRLARLAQLRSMEQLSKDQLRLVDYALYSTYWDCVRRGQRALAQQILGMPTA